ncbi:hypothetical protein LZ31DRAFT_231508 [Colletotrichum somersetense]|nr:hypothetical protein LZ31DRAFT_231508 [Colletotrichum somersetense]
MDRGLLAYRYSFRRSTTSKVAGLTDWCLPRISSRRKGLRQSKRDSRNCVKSLPNIIRDAFHPALLCESHDWSHDQDTNGYDLIEEASRWTTAQGDRANKHTHALHALSLSPSYEYTRSSSLNRLTLPIDCRPVDGPMIPAGKHVETRRSGPGQSQKRKRPVCQLTQAPPRTGPLITLCLSGVLVSRDKEPPRRPIFRNKSRIPQQP